MNLLFYKKLKYYDIQSYKYIFLYRRNQDTSKYARTKTYKLINSRYLYILIDYIIKTDRLYLLKFIMKCNDPYETSIIFRCYIIESCIRYKDVRLIFYLSKELKQTIQYKDIAFNAQWYNRLDILAWIYSKKITINKTKYFNLSKLPIKKFCLFSSPENAHMSRNINDSLCRKDYISFCKWLKYPEIYNDLTQVRINV